MERTHHIAVLAGLTVLGLGILSPATAETTTVTRGPNGATHLVKVDQIPNDAQVRPNNPAQGFPDIVVRGAHGAAHIARPNTVRPATAQSSDPVQVVQRGPNGAAHLR
ncbi:hypothetical protein [Acaryochloris sp. IP29b_bin.148]|uniref:hypothetical protein n=1 Tax=Acaryochloris sp. IP29b_bin.148 TaxID=2969218 RepID=UPI0026190FBD|nr:hypothetical protein [Acaryochloris sp. IP29b_bin.148]